MSGDALLQMVAARQALRDAVLRAILSDNTEPLEERFIAWKDVDAAAVQLAKARRAYDKHVKEVARNAGRVAA